MTRRARTWLAPLLLALGATTAHAQAAPAPTEAPSGESSEGIGIPGYLFAGALSAAIIFTVCKPAHRELNTPKPGQADKR